MSRRRRGWVDNACYHVTHRCHERKFLFRFARHREMYRTLLREGLSRYPVSVLDYIITSNHVHILIRAKQSCEISPFLQFVHGGMAQKYNLNKDREGAFWSDRFHSTRIQSGAHLGYCMFYIDLNMVRAGAVSHPGEWEHTAYHEFVGERQRYRIIDKPALLNALNMEKEQFHDWYLRTLDAKLGMKLEQETFWSEAMAVGDIEFLKESAREAEIKRFEINKAWSTFKEEKSSYINFSWGKKRL